MSCYGFKGGNGTSSRIVRYAGRDFVVAAFVQANFGARADLTITGVPVGPALAVDNPIEDDDWFDRDLAGSRVPPGSGSVIVVLATDAPLLPGQCKALARRVPMGLARTGSSASHFSGDLFLAFSTAEVSGLVSSLERPPEGFEKIEFVPWGYLDEFFRAAIHCVEESVLNALVVNEDMVGRDHHWMPALPRQQTLDLLSRTR